MAELLIRVVDKVNANDADANMRLLKRGDVVDVRPDGWGWSALELSSPWWCLVRVPGASVDDLAVFLSPETGPPGSKTLRPRANSFDLSGYSADTGAVIPVPVAAFERRKSPRSGPARAGLPQGDKTSVLTRYIKAKT